MIIIDKKKYSASKPDNKQKVYSLEEKNTRRNERQQIYNCAVWRKLRQAKLYDCPICEDCQK
jgi:hypothetical protein